MKGINLFALIGLFVLLIVAGCGGSGTGNGTGSNRTGTLEVRLADAPDPTVTAVNLTINRVEAHRNGRWTNLAIEPRRVNLLDLAREDILLGRNEVPTGRYNQVRVFVSDATVTDENGTFPVTIPSAAQTGIKLNVNYDINENEITVLLLDFNVAKSLIRQGNGQYRLQPVIPVVVKTLSGSATGSVQGPGGNLHGATVTAVYTDGPSYPLGTEVNVATTLSDGTYKLWALLPGTYRLNFRWVGEDDTVYTAVRNGIVVTANSNTDVGIVTLE